MTEFEKIIITLKGKSLISKLIAGEQTELTKISLSNRSYDQSSIERLASISDIKQNVPIEKISRFNETLIKIKASMSNESLEEGYFMNTVGIYAIDPDEGEILFAVMRTAKPSWVPPYTGSSVSVCVFNITLAVGNTENVNIELDTNVASVTDIFYLQEQLDIEKKKNTILMSIIDKALFTVSTTSLFEELEALNETNQSALIAEESEK